MLPSIIRRGLLEFTTLAPWGEGMRILTFGAVHINLSAPKGEAKRVGGFSLLPFDFCVLPFDFLFCLRASVGQGLVIRFLRRALWKYSARRNRAKPRQSSCRQTTVASPNGRPRQPPLRTKCRSGCLPRASGGGRIQWPHHLTPVRCDPP